MINLIHLLQKANIEYDRGNLPTAKKYIDEVLTAFRMDEVSMDLPSASVYLNALTLAQSIASVTHDITAYEQYESSVREWMLRLLGDYSQSYYAIHLLDACECYLNAGDTAKAQQLLVQAVSILEEENGACPLISFLQAYFTARLHFQMNQYHQCIDSCQEANQLWQSDVLIPENATTFLQHYLSNETGITRMITLNLILTACAYGKINSPELGITILTELKSEPIEDYYVKTSADLILAELYTRSGQLTKAREIYHNYKKTDFTAYPDLHASLATLSNVLETQSFADAQPLFAAQYDGQLSGSVCYSQDAFQIQLYDYGLKLIAAGQYTQALTLYHQLGERGLSLKLFLLAKTENYRSIPDTKKQADLYYDREIRSLFLYYDERLVHNHLSLLEYHFSLCMDAYIACHEQLGEDTLPAKDIYDFLLNTKYISMEAAYLSRKYQTLEAVNNRKSFTCSEIMEKLSENEVLLEYCITRTITESFYCVFLITSTRIFCIRLETQSVIDALIVKWHTLIQSSAHAAVSSRTTIAHNLKETETLLRRYLYRPIKEVLSSIAATHMIISPAGSLVHFPFSCLPVSSSSYLENQYEITYVNTAKELITNPPIANPKLESALVAGGPSYHKFAPLPYAKQEAEAVAACLHARCFTGNEVSLDLFEYCLDGAPSLVHIATHGVFYENNRENNTDTWNTAFHVMENSGLILTDDTLLSCNMISAMDFSDTYLTVLSACQTGRGLFHSSEGVYGLRRAFRLAGCHSMIISLWQVDDHCGCYFMQQFYMHMIENSASPRHAFSLALNDLRTYKENNICPFNHPYYWAGYIFIE